VIGRTTTGPLSAAQKITRTNYFADFSLNFLVLKLVAEGGIISRGVIPTSNVFDVAANVDRSYGAVAVRIAY